MDAPAPPPAPADPLATLRAEHGAILQVLDAVERELQAVANGAPFVPVRWLAFARFFVEFADRRHHAKEEDLLFPQLVRYGLGEEGPVGIMRQQHQETRSLVRWIERNASAGDAQATTTAALAYVELLREHIHIEDDVLWPMAQYALPATAMVDLAREFAAVDRSLGVTDGLAEFTKAAAALCRQG